MSGGQSLLQTCSFYYQAANVRDLDSTGLTSLYLVTVCLRIFAAACSKQMFELVMGAQVAFLFFCFCVISLHTLFLNWTLLLLLVVSQWRFIWKVCIIVSIDYTFSTKDTQLLSDSTLFDSYNIWIYVIRGVHQTTGCCPSTHVVW